jgi:hypothetical protein
VRIWDWRLKLVYVLVAYGLGWALAPALDLVDDHGLLSAAINLAVVLIGARIFRGDAESIGQPRAWWRMTSRPRLSRFLGGLSIAFAVLVVLALVLPILVGLPHDHIRPSNDPTSQIILIANLGAFGFLYLNSAVRLERMDLPERTRLSRVRKLR